MLFRAVVGINSSAEVGSATLRLKLGEGDLQARPANERQSHTLTISRDRVRQRASTGPRQCLATASRYLQQSRQYRRSV